MKLMNKKQKVESKQENQKLQKFAKLNFTPPQVDDAW